MFSKRIAFLPLILIVICTHVKCANPMPDLVPRIDSRKLIPTPIDLIKWQIDVTVNFVEKFIDSQLAILKYIRNLVTKILLASIDTSLKIFDTIFFDTWRFIYKVEEKLIEKGLNITECFVLTYDKLIILEGRLIVNTIKCATSQADRFYEIIDGAIEDINSHLLFVLQFPIRFQKCFRTLRPMKCFTELGADVINMQRKIPKQILDKTFEIIHYLTLFQYNLDKCTFAEVRKYYKDGFKVLDDYLTCLSFKSGQKGSEIEEILQEVTEFRNSFNSSITNTDHWLAKNESFNIQAIMEDINKILN